MISLIAALARNRVIGAGNRLPWKIPEDLRRFRELTTGKPVIMGRKTWESIGRPLPGRRNLVVSRQADFRAEGAEVFASLEAALAACEDASERFVIGGAEIYSLALGRADRLYLTLLERDVEGDAYFPEFSGFREVAREERAEPEKFAFLVLERTGAAASRA